MIKKITISALLFLCTSVAAWSQTPNISAKTTTPCSGLPFDATPINGADGFVPSGTTYTWSAPVVTGGITGGAAGTNATSFGGTLTNPTNQQQTAIYIVTPTAGATGNPFTVTVVVNPFATLSDIVVTPGAAVICAGLSTTLTAALSGTSTISNPNFTWYSHSNLTGLLGSGATIGSGLLNNNTDFFVTVSGTNACANTVPLTATITISGVAPDVSQPANITACDGTAVGAIVFTSTSSGITYNWTNDVPSIGVAAALSGTIAAFTATNSSSVNVTATITVTPFTSTNGCFGSPKTFTILVGAMPVISDLATSTCSSSTMNYAPTGTVVPSGTGYTWVPTTVATGIFGAFTQSSAQASLNPTLSNSMLVPLSASFMVTPKTGSPASCVGAPFTITVTVNPTPVISNKTTTTCSGVAFLISPTGVPSDTRYTWGVPTVTGSVGGSSSQGSQQTSIGQTLINNDPTNSIVRYNITPVTSAGCTGAAFSGTVTVSPKPTLVSNTPITSCNNVITAFTPTSAVVGTTFSWTRTAVNNISNATVSGTDAFNETLNNTGTANELVTYQYTLSANGCSNTQNLQVTVKPTLTLSSDLTRSTCSNSLFTYTGISATASTVLSWSRTTVAGITNSAASGTSAVSETLINTTFDPINVTYQYLNTSTVGGTTCSDVNNVVVTVNPLPVVNTIASQVICSGLQDTIVVNGSNVSGTLYNWTNSNANINLTNSGEGTITFLANNVNSVPISSTVTITPTANNCSSTPLIFSITVKPAPALSSVLTIPAVCSGVPVAYSPTSTVSGVTFTWSRQAVTGIDNVATTSSGGVQETLTNSSNIPLQVPYNYTLTANGCSNDQLVNVTVNPVPTMFNPGDQLACNNSTKVVNFNGSIVSGTTYLWTNDNTAIGVPAVGTGDIFFVANTTTTDSVFANITAHPQAYGCNGPQVAFRIVINPPLSLNSSLTPAAICSNALFGYTPSSTAANPIYIWNRSALNGISNAPASGSGSIQEILINTTSSPISVVYDFTLSSNGCVKNESVRVQVSPALVLNNANIANEACSGTAFNFSPNGNITGAQYLWSRAVTTGITNAAANGTGDINETLVNTTDQPIEVIYRYSLGQAATCAADQLVRVTVKPIPTLTGSKTINACSNAPVAYTPVANIAGTNFNWSRAAVTGIANTSAIGLVGISESLINTTAAPVNAIYLYSLTNYNGCSNTEQVTVAVKPGPVASVGTDQSICADDIAKAITFSSSIPNTTFNWTNSEPAIGLAASGTGATIPAFKSVNTSSGQLVGIIQVVAVADGCGGNPVTVARITVNRAITTSFIETLPSVACPNQLVGPFIASIPLGGDGSTYLFQWQVSTDSVNFTNITGATSRQLFAPAITKDSWYRMNTVSLGCSAVTPQVKIPLKPKPVITLDNRDNYTISIGNSTQVVASGAVIYLWSPPATVSDFRSSSPFLNPIVTTKYSVTGTTADGCSDSVNFTITVNLGYKIYPNNILTPNGDGYNDVWKIKNIEYYPDNSVKVYNVNSALVMTEDGYGSGVKPLWAGTGLDGLTKLPSGTYYYVITLKKGDTIIEKGYLTILN